MIDGQEKSEMNDSEFSPCTECDTSHRVRSARRLTVYRVRHVIIIVSAWFARWRSAFKTLDYKYYGKTLTFLKIFYDAKLNMAKSNEVRPFSIFFKQKISVRS